MTSPSTSLKKIVISLLILLSIFSVATEVAAGTTYTIEWTVGGANYSNWSDDKYLRAGDSVVFKYDNRYHNLLMVKRSEYWACDSSSPMWTYTSGNDEIKIKRPEQLYYICGFPGHCQQGQRIRLKGHY